MSINTTENTNILIDDSFVEHNSKQDICKYVMALLIFIITNAGLVLLALAKSVNDTVDTKNVGIVIIYIIFIICSSPHNYLMMNMYGNGFISRLFGSDANKNKHIVAIIYFTSFFVIYISHLLGSMILSRAFGKIDILYTWESSFVGYMVYIIATFVLAFICSLMIFFHECCTK